METYKLQSGGSMPVIGYGTFLVSLLKLILIELVNNNINIYEFK